MCVAGKHLSEGETELFLLRLKTYGSISSWQGASALAFIPCSTFSTHKVSPQLRRALGWYPRAFISPAGSRPTNEVLPLNNPGNNKTAHISNGEEKNRRGEEKYEWERSPSWSGVPREINLQKPSEQRQCPVVCALRLEQAKKPKDSKPSFLRDNCLARIKTFPQCRQKGVLLAFGNSSRSWSLFVLGEQGGSLVSEVVMCAFLGACWT